MRSYQAAVSQPGGVAWVASDYAAVFHVFVCVAAVEVVGAVSVHVYWERTEMKDWGVVMVSPHQWIAQPLLPRVKQILTQYFIHTLSAHLLKTTSHFLH